MDREPNDNMDHGRRRGRDDRTNRHPRDSRSLSAGASAHGKKEDPSSCKCVSCMDDLKESDILTLSCQSGHMLCGECSAVYCESVMAEGPFAVVPNPKCGICRAPIPALAFERSLKPEQHTTYLTYVAMQAMEEGESLLSCVNCKYSEVHADSPPLFFCKNSLCATVHCLGCKKKFPPINEEENDDEAFEQGQAEREKHLMCHALRLQKDAFDSAIAAGNGMACPGCGVVGRKDGMCTHMTCSGCDTVWCYLCGLSVEDCDNAPRIGEAAGEPIYGHNENWKYNSNRCPMFITMIAEVDDDWDMVDEAADNNGDYDQERLEELCLNKFHKWRALQELKDLRGRLGEETWNDLRSTFPSVRNCGFSDEEIAAAEDTPLFTRPEIRDRVRQRR